MNTILLLIKYIIEDMAGPIRYLPWGLCAGCLYLLIMKLRRHFTGRDSEKGAVIHDIITFLMIIYFITLLILTLFSREPGSRRAVNLQLFATWGYNLHMHVFFLENILLFIPFGILTPAVFSRLQGFIKCSTAALLCSVALELLQFITARGYCELDDVITNTIGGMIGYIFYRVWKKYIFPLYFQHS